MLRATATPFWLLPSGKTPEKYYKWAERKQDPKFKSTRTLFKSFGGRPKIHYKFPEIVPELSRFLSTHGLEAARNRDVEISRTSAPLSTTKLHLETVIGGLKEYGCSKNTIARLYLAPHKGRASKSYYTGSILARKLRAKNNKRKEQVDSHYYATRVKLVEQLAQHWNENCLVLSCDNKNKVNIGSAAVSRQVEPLGYQMLAEMVEDAGLDDHDFPCGYKCIPMGQMVLEPYERNDTDSLPVDALGRQYYEAPRVGEVFVTLRAGFTKATIEPHINDLIPLLKSKLGNRTVLVLVTDNGPDWNSGSAINHIYFARLFKALRLDVMFVLSYAPGRSCNNAIEHAWCPLTRSLAGIKYSACAPGDTVPPMKLTGVSEEERAQKRQIVHDRCMKNIAERWSKIRWGGNDRKRHDPNLTIKASYQPSSDANFPYNDHADVKENVQ